MSKTDLDALGRLSNILYGGELAWTKIGIDEMFNELKRRLNKQNRIVRVVLS